MPRMSELLELRPLSAQTLPLPSLASADHSTPRGPQVNVTLLDINDNHPTWKDAPYHINLVEMTPPDSDVTTVRRDIDAPGWTHSYRDPLACHRDS